MALNAGESQGHSSSRAFTLSFDVALSLLNLSYCRFDVCDSPIS